MHSDVKMLINSHYVGMGHAIPHPASPVGIIRGCGQLSQAHLGKSRGRRNAGVQVAGSGVTEPNGKCISAHIESGMTKAMAIQLRNGETEHKLSLSSRDAWKLGSILVSSLS